MESVIAMSRLTGTHRFERSCLPAVAQLDLHVDAHDFQALVQRIELEGELLEKLAEAAHELFVQQLLHNGYTLGPKTDEVQKTHSSLKPYASYQKMKRLRTAGMFVTFPTSLREQVM